MANVKTKMSAATTTSTVGTNQNVARSASQRQLGSRFRVGAIRILRATCSSRSWRGACGCGGAYSSSTISLRRPVFPALLYCFMKHYLRPAARGEGRRGGRQRLLRSEMNEDPTEV